MRKGSGVDFTGAANLLNQFLLRQIYAYGWYINLFWILSGFTEQ